MNNLLNKIINDTKIYANQGEVATYIPELSKMNKNISGIVVVDMENNIYSAGDTNIKFTIQSMSNIVTLILALMDHGEKVFDKVGKEPSGDPFNSLKRLTNINTHKPFNPMINAGSITITSMVKANNKEERIERIIKLIKDLSGNKDIEINMDVYNSELKTGDKNRSIAYFLKDKNILEGEVCDVLDTYFKQCSIEINCFDLANIGATLANDGISTISGKRIVPSEYATIAKAFMFTCGMYDDSGEFAVEVGIPAKSGVSGGIFCSVPNKMGIGVLGPSLDKKGNSIVGIEMLKILTNEKKLCIFN
ncbi:glutaminase A [Clostridiaceae bacterium HSG29]|nr:glutaminase A [Clostridiaceae bacterium HSG29]